MVTDVGGLSLVAEASGKLCPTRAADSGAVPEWYGCRLVMSMLCLMSLLTCAADMGRAVMSQGWNMKCPSLSNKWLSKTDFQILKFENNNRSVKPRYFARFINLDNDVAAVVVVWEFCLRVRLDFSVESSDSLQALILSKQCGEHSLRPIHGGAIVGGSGVPQNRWLGNPWT